MSTEEELGRLSATIGIDLNALKEKYSVAQTKQQGGSSVASMEAREAHEKLEGYSLCKSCMGSGLMTVVYNHISTQKNCVECGGEGILQKLESRVNSIVNNIALNSAAVLQAESAYDVSLTLPPQVFTASTANANVTATVTEA